MTRRDQIGDGATSAAGGDRGRDDCAALRVLSQRPLLRHIASFAPGLPFLVGEFAADGAQRFPDAIGRLYPQPRGFLPQLAIICDDLPMLARLRELSRRPEHAEDPRLEFHEVVRCAVLLGRPAALQWLVESGALDLETYPFEGNLVNYAIHFGGGPAMLDWLADHVPHRFLSLRTWQLCFAASRGQLHAIQWLHAHPELCDFTPAVMDAAATGGHLDIVRFLHEHRAEGCTVEAMDMAAANGHLEVVAFLHEHRTEGCTTVAMGCAAAFGHAAVVRYLGEHRKEGPYDRALEDAAGNGHLDAVRALLRWSNRGCLVQARRRAAKAQNTAIAAFLASQTADRVWTCSLKRHEPHGPRRCQRPLDLTDKPANALVRWLFRSQQKDQDAAGVSVVVAR